VAGYGAIAAAAKSLERLLTKRFAIDVPVKPNATTRAVLVSTDDFDVAGKSTVIKPPVLSIFLVRVEVNPVTRAAWSAVGSDDHRSHLPLDLHFLLTPWAANAEHEQRILGSAMRCLDEGPMLSGPLLDTTHGAGFGIDEALQIVPGDLGPDGIMRIWDTLDANYRLSVPYIVRIVRIDSDVAPSGPPVLTAYAGVTPSVDP
jgi:Pvc16 N-terminal domain